MIATRIATFLYDDGRSTRVLRGALVTANALDYLGMPPIIGRPFTGADGRPGAAAVFLLTDRTWRSEFGADRDLVGETFRLNGEPATLIGVMLERFDAYGADLWTAMNTADWGAGSTVMGRLRPGIGLEAATADLDVNLQRLAQENPAGFFPARFTTVLRPYLDTVLAISGGRCSDCWLRCVSCWRLPASTSPICCWRARRFASATSRCALRSERQTRA